MNATELNQYLDETFDGLRVLENAGDTFFLYDPDGDLPPERQIPFITVVTGNSYDSVSRLDWPGAYRLNLGLTKATYTSMFGTAPTERDEHGVLTTGFDYAVPDQVMPHPIYASQYWVSVVTPSPATFEALRPLLAEAHEYAARKYTNQRARRDERSAGDEVPNG